MLNTLSKICLMILPILTFVLCYVFYKIGYNKGGYNALKPLTPIKPMDKLITDNGTFQWIPEDMTDEIVHADINNNHMYVVPFDSMAGASGLWVREHEYKMYKSGWKRVFSKKPVKPEWFGLKED